MTRQRPRLTIFGLCFSSIKRLAMRAAPSGSLGLIGRPFDIGPFDFGERAALRARHFPNPLIALRIEPRQMWLVASSSGVDAANDLAVGERQRPLFGQRHRVALGGTSIASTSSIINTRAVCRRKLRGALPATILRLAAGEKPVQQRVAIRRPGCGIGRWSRKRRAVEE